MLEKGWIRRSRSNFAAPVFFVGKKDAGARMVIDYREIKIGTINVNYKRVIKLKSDSFCGIE